jgi:murein DD-endopeptidase MepM/ murein hydrolase activator NlpD
MRQFLALVGVVVTVGCVATPPAPQGRAAPSPQRAATAASPRPLAPPAERPVAPPVMGQGSSARQTHRVERGETLWSIARRWGVTVGQLKQANGLTGDTIVVGQELTIPSAGGGGAGVSSASPNASGGLTWPVPGLRQSREEGDALLIYAPEGSSVVAAASGRVNYLSPDVRGLGSVVMLEHGGGLVTFYGNLREVAVSVGQTVRRGDPVGRVGPGDVGGPRLRFMVFRDEKAVSARGYFP